MTALRSRLVFGTARLAGGAYASQSRRMIEACVTAGITAFDTAPGYGMGAAEALLGDVTQGMAGIALHTKVGSARPAVPALRGWAKRLRNLAANRAATARIDAAIEPFGGVPAGIVLTPRAIEQSLARSHDLLRRDRIELVLLHEAEPQLIDPEAWDTLRSAQNAGRVGQLGFAHNGPAQCADPALVTQTSPLPQYFLMGAGPQPRIFHSVRRAFRQASRDDPAVAAAAVQASRKLDLRLSEGAAEYLIGLLLLAQADPAAKVIFATSRPENLGEFLALLDRIEPAA